MSPFLQAIIMMFVKYFLEELQKKSDKEVEATGTKAGIFAKAFKAKWEGE